MRFLIRFAPLCAFTLSSLPAAAKDDRFRCRAAGTGNRQAEIRVEPGKFRAKWQINKGEGQDVGTIVNVAINGEQVGAIILKDDGRQLEGKIEQRGRFAATLPAVKAGTPGQVGSLTCVFRRD